MKNDGQQCFKWCIARACNPVKSNSERVTKKLQEQAEELNWKGVNFPTSFSDIHQFEKNNKISLVVLGYDVKDEVSILRVPKEKNEKTVALLLIKDEDGNKHYCLVKNLSRLLAFQVSKGNRKRHYCHYCPNGFNTEISLMNHKEYYLEHDCVKIEFPEKGENDLLKFINHERMHKVPLVIYADFECFTKPFNKRVADELLRVAASTAKNNQGWLGWLKSFILSLFGKRSEPANEENPASSRGWVDRVVSLVPNLFRKTQRVAENEVSSSEQQRSLHNQQDPNKGFTNQYQKHEPSGFCYYVKRFDDRIYEHNIVSYTKKTDENITQIFVNKLEETVKKIHNEFKFTKKMIYRKEDKDNYENSTDCYVCEGELGDDKVRDHCHFSGRYRGAAHNKCSLKLRRPDYIPVIFHNLEGYDSHLFMKNLGVTDGNIERIRKNEEKYISFTKSIVVDTYTDKKTAKLKIVKKNIRFTDSFKFMSSSLGKLADNLGRDKFYGISKCFPEEKLDLLLRKGVYPYDFVDSLDKLNEKELPPKEEFYTKLNDEGISDEDYNHAQKVWKEFVMKSMRDYHDLYLMSDVLILTDVFESFREVCLDNYKLDPAWYYTSPGLSWDAMLKLTKVELDLLTDPEMYLMIVKGIRDGVSMISTPYSKANNPYTGDKYDPNSPAKYIPYLDANNLYGWAMSKSLPIHEFEWMNEEDLNNWENIPCIFEVDLEYPQELHDKHNDYPLAPEKFKVGKVEKLIPNLYDKKKYVIHRDNMKQYKSLGMKITKIHKGIKFHEEPWLEKYITLNTKLRTEAKNDFEKDFLN